MDDSLDEIIARHEAATTCGCCCDDDFAAYVEQKKREHLAQGDGPDNGLPDSAASRRGSMRYVFETQLATKGK